MAVQRNYESQVVRLADLTIVSNQLRGLDFENCLLLGPAILIPQGKSTFTDCDLGGPTLDAVFWIIEAHRELVVGAIIAEDCAFRTCRFEGVGIGGPTELRDKLAEGVPFG